MAPNHLLFDVNALFDEIDALALASPGPALVSQGPAMPPILASQPRLKFTPALLRIPAWLPASPLPSPINEQLTPPFVASPVSSPFSHEESFSPPHYCSSFPYTLTHTPFVPSTPLPFSASPMTPPPLQQQLNQYQQHLSPLPPQTPYIPRRRATVKQTNKPAPVGARGGPREYMRRDPLLTMHTQFLTSRFEDNCKPSIDEIKQYAAVIGKDEKKVQKWFQNRRRRILVSTSKGHPLLGGSSGGSL
ncbi:hypothetical protein HDU98_008134 [Podochytrium sp. JEL0797]|nr:hypothetical protein HDU98_008134 [Podochytrium sp. JEL0797]